MLTAVKLVDQWAALERRLPADWETVELRLRTEQANERSEAARILGPMNVGFVGDELAFSVRRAVHSSRCRNCATPIAAWMSLRRKL